MDNNTFSKASGVLMDIYRGGNDESTLGPQLYVRNNQFKECNSSDEALIQLTGVQRTRFTGNTFNNCNTGKTLFIYKDIVRADHLQEKNTFISSGSIQGNAFLSYNH